MKTQLARVLIILVAVLLIVWGVSDPGDNTGQATDPGNSEELAADSTSQVGSRAPTVAPTEDEKQLPESYNFIQPWTGDLDGMTERRRIRVLTVYSVGRYYLDGSQEKGLVREAAQRFEDFINQRLKRKHVRVHVVVIPVARNQLIPSLLSGHGDLVDASLSITNERNKILDFSKPSSKPLSEILVTGPTAPALASIDDLSGQTLHLRLSSSYRESVDRLNQRLISEGKAPVKIEAVSELLEDDDLVEMVNAGLLPWAIVDDYKVQWWDDIFTELVARRDIVFRSGGQIAWAMRKNSPQLKQAVNEFLKTHREGTLVGNVLKNRYIRDFDWAANALAQEDYLRFSNLKHIFQKYGELYGIEYLMVAAQGYQESRLNQSARSKSGAMGVMQVKPTTAADKNVNIRDIHQVDNNIHAGVKYLEFLRSRYFDDPKIDELNQTLLALAAYNVGPNRMIKLRQQTERSGYDPNVWFDNVELIAAKQVGREPVQYVANIYKYYLAYRLSAGQVSQRQEARQRAGIEEAVQPSG